LDEELRRHLPREEGKPVEKPAEAALRTKMCDPAKISDSWFSFLSLALPPLFRFL
jgi:hypothetical protein